MAVMSQSCSASGTVASDCASIATTLEKDPPQQALKVPTTRTMMVVVMDELLLARIKAAPADSLIVS